MSMVLGNQVVFGTVSSNRSHFDGALLSLAEIERKWPHWLVRLITERLTLDDLDKALESPHYRIKTVIQMS